MSVNDESRTIRTLRSQLKQRIVNNMSIIARVVVLMALVLSAV